MFWPQLAHFTSPTSGLFTEPSCLGRVYRAWSLACTLVGYKTVLRLDWSQTLLGYAPVFLLEMFLLLQVMQML